MKSLVTGLAISILLLMVSAANAEGTIDIYRQDGSLQCVKGSGDHLGEVAEELMAKGIRVQAQRRDHDGLFRAQLCNTPTGFRLIYTILESDLNIAREEGFRPL